MFRGKGRKSLLRSRFKGYTALPANLRCMKMPFAAIGHRGAPRRAPGNTMISFQTAFDLGCNWVECDCRASADGIIVLAHDDSVTDRAGRRYTIAEHSREELARLDLGQGEGVPTLEDLVAWASLRGCGIMADIKQGGLEQEISDLLSVLPRDGKIVPGADAAVRRRFRELFPDLPISLSVDAAAEAALEAGWQDIDTDAVTFQYPLVTPARVADLQRRGIRVYPWTVDDPATMRALLEMGVDGIISNRSDLLIPLLPH